MFEPVSSWSLPDHLYQVSAWSARCRTRSPMSCVNDIVGPYGVKQFNQAVQQELTSGQTSIDLAWTDITWLLYAHHVSWAYYVQAGIQPDCGNDSVEACAAVKQSAATPGIWNPLPLFGDVQHDHQLRNIQSLDSYFAAAKAGKLPAVSWITPSGNDSEHPPASVHQGQAFATAVINAAMKSPDWKSTAIFLSWDDLGGFYDHVLPAPGIALPSGRAPSQRWIGGHRSCWAAIGSPAHSCIASRLSWAGYLAAAGPSAKARSRLVVTRLVKAAARRFRPNRRSPLQHATQRIVPAANTPAPPPWV